MVVCRFLQVDGSGWTSDAIECLQKCREEEQVHFTVNAWGGGPFSQALYDELKVSYAGGRGAGKGQVCRLWGRCLLGQARWALA